MQLANLFWQVAKRGRATPLNKEPIKPDLRIEKEGRRHDIQKLILGMLVHYPDFLDEKGDSLTKVELSSSLEDFRLALYDLLIMSADVSVQVIYSRLKPDFYEVLQDIHGERTADRPWGHRLFQRFPILNADPPHKFISECIDHFIQVLRVEQMEDEIEQMLEDASISDDASTRLLTLIREFQLQSEVVKSTDILLAEEAKEIKRAFGAAEYGMAA